MRANPRLWTAPPCIWPSTPSGLIALPASWTTTNSWSVELARVRIHLDPGQLGGEGRRLHRERDVAHAEHRRHLGHVEVALLADLGERDRPARHAANRHLAVLELEVLDGRLHLGGGDLERLAAGILRRLHHRGADRVDRLAARAEPGEGRTVGVAGRDADLVDVDPVGGRGDLRQPDVRAGDVDLAGEDLQRPVGLSRTVAPVGWSPGIQPPDRQPRAAQPVSVLAAAGRPLLAALPQRVLGEPRAAPPSPRCSARAGRWPSDRPLA